MSAHVWADGHSALNPAPPPDDGRGMDPTSHQSVAAAIAAAAAAAASASASGSAAAAAEGPGSGAVKSAPGSEPSQPTVMRPRASRAPLAHAVMCRYAGAPDFIEVSTLNISQSGMCHRGLDPAAGRQRAGLQVPPRERLRILSGSGTVMRHASGPGRKRRRGRRLRRAQSVPAANPRPRDRAALGSRLAHATPNCLPGWLGRLKRQDAGDAKVRIPKGRDRARARNPSWLPGVLAFPRSRTRNELRPALWSPRSRLRGRRRAARFARR